MLRHRGIGEHPMHDLKFSHRPTRMLTDPRLTLNQGWIDEVRHPAIALAQESNEIWATSSDLLEADRQHAALGYLLVSDPPPQINLAPRDAAGLAQCPQLGKNALDELIPLPFHVTEGRRHEHAHHAPRGASPGHHISTPIPGALWLTRRWAVNVLIGGMMQATPSRSSTVSRGEAVRPVPGAACAAADPPQQHLAGCVARWKHQPEPPQGASADRSTRRGRVPSKRTVAPD